MPNCIADLNVLIIYTAIECKYGTLTISVADNNVSTFINNNKI